MTPDLTRLAEMCEGAEVPSRELDAAIVIALRIWPGVKGCEWIKRWEGEIAVDAKAPGRVRHKESGCWWSARYYTASLDAARTLVPEGWYWRAGHGVLWAGWAHLNRKHPDHCDRDDEHSAHAETPALALCAAALRARATLAQAGEGRSA